MNRGQAVPDGHVALSSVVIGNFHVKGVSAIEAKAYAPLIVDADVRGKDRPLDADAWAVHVRFYLGAKRYF